MSQVIRGLVTDSETRVPLAGAGVILETREGRQQTVTDESGMYRITTEAGRVTVRISYLGYSEVFFCEVLVGTGKEVELNTELTETVISTGDIIVTAGRKSSSSVNTMATVSSLTLRSADALRFASGYYDPSRMRSSVKDTLIPYTSGEMITITGSGILQKGLQ